MPVPSDWEPLRLSSEKSRLSFQDNAPENEPVEPEMVAVNTDGVVAVNVSFEKCRWDFFLSHKQSNAQDAVQNLRLALGEKFLGASFWLDIEQGITDSKFCQMEMRWALAAKRNIILVMETDERHGKPDMEQLIRRCPNDLKQIFEGEIIPWFRDPEFRAVSVEKIIRSIARDPRTEVREKSKPLMYGKSSGEDAEGAEVFDRSFVIFTAMCGVALPGAGPRTRCWAVAVRIILLTCGMMCCSRIFTPEGPGFYDYETIVQIVAAHPMIFLLLHVMLVLLRSDLIADLLDNHIDCASEGQKLRFKTKILTALVALLTATLSLWGWAGYLPGFFHPYYLESGNGLIVYGIAHGLTWILILPVFFGSFFSALMIMFILQELCYMALLTAFNELNGEIHKEGLDSVLATGAGMGVTEHDLFRFQVKYAKSWELYKKIQRRVAMPLFVFWCSEFLLVIWSSWSLSRGFTADPEDPRVVKLKAYWNLIIRLSWFVGGSPWFGAGCWIVGLLPWGSLYYSWRMDQTSKLLLFKLPSMRNAFREFLSEFPLDFRVGLLRARPWTLLIFVPVLGINTAGFVADAMRIFNAI
ncbi:unnamed protein product [Effrenium voratum]|nr:unnamed protein product [Effrenium voratum]